MPLGVKGVYIVLNELCLCFKLYYFIISLFINTLNLIRAIHTTPNQIARIY